MKNRKILIAIGITIAMLIVISLITVFIIKLNEDKKKTEENMILINDSYNSLKNDVENYNSIRESVSKFINDFYYDTIDTKYVDNLKILNNYDSVIGKITGYVKILDDKCNFIYMDKDVSNICSNYKIDYETIVNVFMNDINNYNNKLNSYNEEQNKSLELFKSRHIDDYIDYNNDNKYEQKVVTNE